jgi:hypothetical protein
MFNEQHEGMVYNNEQEFKMIILLLYKRNDYFTNLEFGLVCLINSKCSLEFF